MKLYSVVWFSEPYDFVSEMYILGIFVKCISIIVFALGDLKDNSSKLAQFTLVQVKIRRATYLLEDYSSQY